MKRRLFGRATLGAGLALAVAALNPTWASAHPLGNFTINHHAGIRIGPDRLGLDLVIDEAEIPAFQARLGLDIDGDGRVSDGEIAAARDPECRKLAAAIHLAVGGVDVPLRLVAAGLSFPPGAGGLSTMRIVCEYDSAFSPVGATATISFRDDSFPERIGWREIVVTGSGWTVGGDANQVRTSSPSDRLTAYPKDLLATPLDDMSIQLTAARGGPVLPPQTVPDAVPVAGSIAGEASGHVEVSAPAAVAVMDAVPGGVSSAEVPSIFRTADLTPLVLVISLLTALALGAGHALTPGHGKTLMAAYLVGTRGTALHAVGLGLSVSLSHTVGILALAAVVVGASDVLPPDTVVRVAPIVAAVSIVAIGGWMLIGELRRRRQRLIPTHHDGQPHHHDPEHQGHDDLTAAVSGERSGSSDQHGNHEHSHGEQEHGHGGIRHTHARASASTITWKSLFALGLAGGLIPSTSALLILLGSIAAGRPAFGFILVVAFGLGMAALMAGIGVTLVLARGRLERMPAGTTLARIRGVVPTAAAVLVFGLGLYLTAQAVTGTPAL